MSNTAISVYSLKPGFQRLLRPLANGWVRTGGTANQLTTFGIATAAATGGAAALGSVHTGWLFAVPALLFLRMALNALDGIVAREFGQASPYGRVFNEMADVAGDALSYLPFIVVFPNYSAHVIVVVFLALLSEFAAVLDPNQRRNEGPLGKSDRALFFGGLALIAGLGIETDPWVGVGLVAAGVALAATIRNRLRRQA
jgi:CDP-diacylglycerol--glycerol-3-phosphate 3-phosphatidyltransferase